MAYEWATVWTQDLTLEFLELYKNASILWDPNHSYRRNKIEVNEAWKIIQKNLSQNLTVKELKKKKESLMASYRKQKSHRRTTWFALPLMESFLGKLEQYDYENRNTSQDTDHEYLEDQDYEPPRGHVSEKPSTDKKYVVFKSKTPKRKRQSVNTSFKSSIGFNKPNTSAAASAEGMDECELYTYLLAKKLRRLDEEQRDMAMHAIDNIMFQAKNTMRNKSAKRQRESISERERDTKSPMIILTQENEMLQGYNENDPIDDEMDATVETLEEYEED